MSKEIKSNNPFASLKKSDFPDKPLGKSDKDFIPKTKIITPKKHNTIQNKNLPSTHLFPTQGQEIEDDFASYLQEQEDASLFIANMGQVQKLPLSAKEEKRKQLAQKTKNPNSSKRTLESRTAHKEKQSSEQQKETNLAEKITLEKGSLLKTQHKTTFVSLEENNLTQKQNQKSKKDLANRLGQKNTQATHIAENLHTISVPHAFAQSLQSLISEKNLANTKDNKEFDQAMREKMPATQKMNNNISSDTLNNEKKYTIISKKQATLQKEQNTPQNPEIEEENLFFSAVSDVKELQGKGRDIAITPSLSSQVSQSIDTKAVNPIQEMVSNSLEIALHSSEEYIEAHVLGLDLSTVAKLQAREYKPEAHIDLHGLTMEHAYNNLIAFFRNSYQRGLRTVLVVTGKGKNSINNLPILRTKTCEWFTQDPFRRIILAFCSAKIEDGGSGALYVLIRKPKKDYGAIDWNIAPTDPELFL